MKFRSLFGAAVVVASFGTVATGLVGTTGVASAHPSGTRPMAFTCTGGEFNPANPPSSTFVAIPSGIYASITVKGACQPAPDAVITVFGNIKVAPGAVFDAQSAPSTITVGHDVTAGPGSLLGLGCLPNPPGHMTGHPCKVDPTGSSKITVFGNLTAWHASAVLLNGITVMRNVTLLGSEGTATVTGRATAIPWAIKNNTIGGNFTAGDMTPIWIGLLLNDVGGNVILFNIHITDGLPPNNDPTPTIQVVLNTVMRNLVCFGNGPNLNVSTPGEANVVGGRALGQCANP